MATPTGIYADRQKDGWSTINKIAQTACRLNGVFGLVLRSKWSGSPAVITLLNALDAVCAALPAAQADVMGTYNGGDNEAIDDDGGRIYLGRLPGATEP